MSSNIRVQRICQHCGNEFTAKTTVTKYCIDTCAKRAYKARKKQEKIDASNKETLKTSTLPFEQLKSKEFLTTAEACKLLTVSRWTIWRKIKDNEIQVSKIGRRTIIKRTELDKFLKLNSK